MLKAGTSPKPWSRNRRKRRSDRTAVRDAASGSPLAASRTDSPSHFGELLLNVHADKVAPRGKQLTEHRTGPVETKSVCLPPANKFLHAGEAEARSRQQRLGRTREVDVIDWRFDERNAKRMAQFPRDPQADAVQDRGTRRRDNNSLHHREKVRNVSFGHAPIFA